MKGLKWWKHDYLKVMEMHGWTNLLASPPTKWELQCAAQSDVLVVKEPYQTGPTVNWLDS